MYSNVKLREVEDLKKYLQLARRLQRIISPHLSNEALVVCVGEFVKKAQKEENKDYQKKLINLCRNYCMAEMNSVCFAQEVLTEINQTRKQLNTVKYEKSDLLDLLKELNKLTLTEKELTVERWQELIKVIKSKNTENFQELYIYFQEIKEIVQRICTTEITLIEGNKRFEAVQVELKKLSPFLTNIN